MKYLLDTNIVLLYLRGDKRTELIESDYQIFDSSNELYISVVTIAELRSFMIRRNYGAPKIKALQTLLEQFRIIDINIESILNRYAEIDAFSQGELPDKKVVFLPGIWAKMIFSLQPQAVSLTYLWLLQIRISVI